MTLETDADLVGLKAIGEIVALTIKIMGEALKPGMTTAELDAIGKRVLSEHGASSAPKSVYKFPGYTCISVNEEAAHGIPGSRVLKDGDLVNIDVSAHKDGYFADSGYTFMLGEVSDTKRRLCEATQEALKEAMSVAKAGAKLNLIGKAIEKVAKKHGFVTLEDLGSHGVGRGLHEEPDFIPNYYDPADKRVLHEGQVITIEPFLSTGAKETRTAADGWTLISGENNLSAQYEHTMVITQEMPAVMT